MADALSKDKAVVVIGAGTMGSGIAEVAAAAGHTVYLRDASDAAIERGLGMIRASLDKRVARGKLDGAERDAVLARVPGFAGPFALDHEGNGIHAEARDPELQPEAHDLADLGLHRRIGGVEVGLKVVEAMEVVLARDLIVAPGRLLHAREHHALVVVFRQLLRPEIVVAILGFGALARILEPGMLIGGVVDDQIDQDAHAELMRLMREIDEVTQRAVGGIHLVVIADVVAVVAARGLLERVQPDARGAQPRDIVEAAHQALEVPDTVTVRVEKRRNVETVDDGVLVPEVLDHVAMVLDRGTRARRSRPAAAKVPRQILHMS